ncbi:MAG TPA: M28 family metallopeptidase [Solirubrobacteraceae bacterium]|nr:M28 family metallopeptidase [Solirubrobacteraceae bacterium]
MSVRVLVVALIVQLALGAGLIVVAVNGFPLIGGGGGDDRPAATPEAAVPKATVDRFDAPRAFALIRRQLAYGQRPAGSQVLRRLAEVLRRQLPDGRFEPVRGHPGLRNIVGTLPGSAPAIVVGAHYDTEYHPKGFVGANDGAAGTAAVVELARALRSTSGREVRFVLFDGEEEGPGCSNARFAECALRGSRAYVAAHRGEVGRMVLLDYIANKGLRLPREGSSDTAMWARVRAAARSVGVGAVFPSSTGTTIYDDHTPFLRAGIPSVDLIDFSYRYADGVRDTLDKLSLASLDAVGETVYAFVSELRRSG